MSKKKKKRRLRKRTIYLMIAFVLLIGAAVCITYLVREHVRLQNQQAYYEELQELASVEEHVEESEVFSEEPVEEPTEESEEVVDLSVYNIPDKQLDFMTLAEENEHIYSWIYIPDTNIDYPIVQHPTELDYYLDHNLDGSEGYPGCIYTQYINSDNFDDFNTVVYGHNMKNGTMFRDLHLFGEESFFAEHPYIYVYTEDGVLVYQIFAAYEFSDIHLLMGFDLSSPEVRQVYIDNIYATEGSNNHYNYDVQVTPDDCLLTLTTCIGNKPDKRYLVAAVLVADGRTAE